MKVYAPLLLIQLILAIVEGQQYQRVCFYTSWSAQRPGRAKYSPEDIDPDLCSHIIYSYGNLRANRLEAANWGDISNRKTEGMYQRLNNLKSRSPRLKTLIAVGGWNLKAYKMTAMLTNDVTRQEFIQSTLSFLRLHNFDGIDLHFMFPGSRSSPRVDAHRFSLLCQELYEAFAEESLLTGWERLIVTVTGPAQKKYIDRGYEVKTIARYAEFINLMTFDLHGPWERATGHHSPLFGTGGDQRLNMEWAARYWVKLGAPKSKLVMGLATYGRGFTLARPTKNVPGARATGPSAPGSFTREGGLLAYYEICQNIKEGATRVWIDSQAVPYITSGNQWVGYDDTTSVTKKVKWLKGEGYGGWMVWSLDLDDFSGGFCERGPYPLISAMNRALRTGQGPDDIIYVPPVTTTTAASLTDDAIEIFCLDKSDGYYRYPGDCRRYITCVWSSAFVHTCGEGLAYNPETKECNSRAIVYTC